MTQVGNRRVPVGKIKFSLPIYYHQTPLIEVLAKLNSTPIRI